MTEKTLFAGFGGQGIISLGQIWVSLGMKQGRDVTFFPFYGAEKRGGIARASCILSDGKIASPVISTADSSVVMSADSLEAGSRSLRNGGLLLVNSSLVPDTDISPELEKRFSVLRIPATAIAERLGNVKIANMVMLGSLAKKTGAVVLENLEEALEVFFPGAKARFIPVNIEGVLAGASAV
jgi:2-oxoglutarate ferredoxin oxidoreductase subunit gamma